MGYESLPVRGVHNHYGPRVSEGTRGVVKTEGNKNEFAADIDNVGWQAPFPTPGVGQGSFWVTNVDQTEVVGGPITALTIGGIDVIAATPAAPVEIPKGNTGVIVRTGGTSGQYIVEFNNYTKL